MQWEQQLGMVETTIQLTKKQTTRRVHRLEVAMKKSANATLRAVVATVALGVALLAAAPSGVAQEPKEPEQNQPALGTWLSISKGISGPMYTPPRRPGETPYQVDLWVKDLSGRNTYGALRAVVFSDERETVTRKFLGRDVVLTVEIDPDGKTANTLVEIKNGEEVLSHSEVLFQLD